MNYFQHLHQLCAQLEVVDDNARVRKTCPLSSLSQHSSSSSKSGSGAGGKSCKSKRDRWESANTKGKGSYTVPPALVREDTDSILADIASQKGELKMPCRRASVSNDEEAFTVSAFTESSSSTCISPNAKMPHRKQSIDFHGTNMNLLTSIGTMNESEESMLSYVRASTAFDQDVFGNGANMPTVPVRKLSIDLASSQ